MRLILNVSSTGKTFFFFFFQIKSLKQVNQVTFEIPLKCYLSNSVSTFCDNLGFLFLAVLTLFQELDCFRRTTSEQSALARI